MKYRSAEHFRDRAKVLAPEVLVDLRVNYGDRDSTCVVLTLPFSDRRTAQFFDCPEAFRFLDGYLRRNDYLG